MPLNRPALSLGPGPRGVPVARRWVVDICHDAGRDDLAECAALGVTELVTNALLHADTPILVRVRGTSQNPRVEVRDATTEPPLLPPADFADDLLVTFGRGLSIVARCASAWGADIESDGKVVWFQPRTEPGEDQADGVITGFPATRRRPQTGEGYREIELRGVPLRAFFDFQTHYRELRREVRLLALVNEAGYPLARTLSDHFGTLERQLNGGLGAYELDDASPTQRNTTDLRVAIEEGGVATVGRFLELLDLADEFCRTERLLALARTPEQRDFQHWFLSEFLRQHDGQAPQAWHDSPVSSPYPSAS